MQQLWIFLRETKQHQIKFEIEIENKSIAMKPIVRVHFLLFLYT